MPTRESEWLRKLSLSPCYRLRTANFPCLRSSYGLAFVFCANRYENALAYTSSFLRVLLHTVRITRHRKLRPCLVA